MSVLRWASAISRHSAPPVTRPAVTVEPACLRIVAPLAVVFGSRAEPGTAAILSRSQGSVSTPYRVGACLSPAAELAVAARAAPHREGRFRRRSPLLIQRICNGFGRRAVARGPVPSAHGADVPVPAVPERPRESSEGRCKKAREAPLPELQQRGSAGRPGQCRERARGSAMPCRGCTSASLRGPTRLDFAHPRSRIVYREFRSRWHREHRWASLILAQTRPCMSDRFGRRLSRGAADGVLAHPDGLAMRDP